MKAWSRRQDWVNAGVGLYLFLSPSILGFINADPATYSGWVLGVLVLMVAVWALAAPESQIPQWGNAVLAVAGITLPWVLGFANLTIAVYSFVIAGLIVLSLSAYTLYQLRLARGSIPTVRAK